MKARFLAVSVLILMSLGCRRASRESDPYWRQIDGIYSEAVKTFTAAYPDPTEQSIEKLKSLRDSAAGLAHPDYANAYHSMKLAELDSGIRLLTAARSHDRAREQAEQQKLIDERQKAYDERTRVLQGG